MSGNTSEDLLFQQCETPSGSQQQVPDCPQEYVDVCARCWDNDMTKRPDAESVLEIMTQIRNKSCWVESTHRIIGL